MVQRIGRGYRGAYPAEDDLEMPGCLDALRLNLRKTNLHHSNLKSLFVMKRHIIVLFL